MKRCPDCNSLFNDADQFCELDGTPLVAAETAADGLVREKAAKVQESNSERSFLPLVGVIGVLIGALLFLVYFALFRERPREETNPSSSNVSTAQPPVTARPPQPRPVENASPSVEPSPSPSVEPSPSPQSTPEPLRLSSNPISTAAGGKSGPVIIKLASGVAIEADEAWQTAEGIWYRRHGVVSLLSPKDIKSIDKVPPPTPQPTASASPSP